MADWLEPLRKLQELDAELFRFRAEQQQKPLALERLRQTAAEMQANAQASEAHLKALQVQQKEKELELSTKEAHIKKLQVQLLQVKTNKEYTATQKEIDQTKADASLLEEEIIGLLDATEQSRQQQRAHQASVTEQQRQLHIEEARVAEELTAIGEQIQRLDQERQRLLPLVDRDTLAVYERVLTSREGLALVPLVNSSCGGCHMVQTPQIINETYLKAKVVTCGNCNRILYADESAPIH